LQSEKPGIQAAIDEIGGPGRPPREIAEQLPLLGDQAEDPPAGQAPAETTGPGRPPGSRNKRTAEWTEYLLGRHASPLEGLAEISSMSIQECKDLARALGCTALQIWERQQWARKELAPYLHQKQPMAIDAGKDGLVVLNLAVPAALAREINNQGGSQGEIQVLDVPHEMIENDEENQ
jgi:hypothetical protein